MARTVDTSSTLENFRQEHNNLANDIGAIGNLTTGDTSSVVNAINYIMDQYFFFQDFDFDGSDGATSNTVFSGADNSSNTLQYSAGKVLVYKNGLLLRNGTDYTASNGTSITLTSSANNGDVIRVSSYTGSYQNVNSDSSTAFDQWQQAGGVIYNKNTGGIVFNADASITTSPTVANSFQFDGPSYHNDHVHVNAVSSSPKELRFRDADNSNYVALLAPTTISTNFSLKLPTSDGNSGELLSTNGSGQLAWAAAGTAPDITITANNSADETVFPVFVDGVTGTQGLESDSGFTYNPSTGRITSTEYSGNVILATQNSITTMTQLDTVGTIGSGTWQGTAIARAYIANDAIDATKIDDNAVGAAALNISGNGSSGQALLSDGDGSFSYGAGGKTTEEIQDIAGAMFSSNTETGISATYEDGDGTIDLVVSGITTAMINDSQITQAKMASNAVDAGVIADNSVGAAELNVSGNGSSGQILASDGDGTFSWAADSGLTNEQVQDIVGAMFSSNSETRISATYQDGDGTIDLVVDDMTADTNTQLSDAQVRSKISGTGLISYNSSTGVISTSATSNTGTVDTSGTPVDNDFAKFTDANTIEGRSIAETKTDLSLNNVENTAISTFAGSGNIATVGTVTTGVWQGTAINQTYLTGQSGTNTGDQTTISGNAGTATTLQTARTIGGVSFNGSANINLPGVNTAGNQNTTGTAAGISGSPTVDLNNLTCDQIGVNVAVNGTDGRIDAGNDIVAFSSSDMTLKENINPITNALDKVLSLGGYTFDWKKDREIEHGYSGSDIGVMAQEVEEVLPTAVRDNCYGNKSVRYEKLIPLLVQSIKELKSELDDLKSSNS